MIMTNADSISEFIKKKKYKLSMTEPEISWKNYYTFYTMTGSKPIYIPKKDTVTVIISLLSGIIYSMNYLMRQIFSKIMWRL